MDPGGGFPPSPRGSFPRTQGRGLAVFFIFSFLALIAIAQDTTKKPSAIAPGPFRREECDIIAEGSICLFNGKKVLMADATPKSLIGHWSFDEAKVLDSSGNANHGKNSIPAGPGFGGHGSSAMFNGFDWAEIPHSPSFNSKEYSITFWMFLYKDPATAVRHGSRWCPILHKGKSNDEKSPSLVVNSKTREMRFVSTTGNTQAPDGEEVLSFARVPVRRWVHVALVRQEAKSLLYINGILDAANATVGKTTTNTGPLYVGGVPWLSDACHLSSYVDGLRFYSRDLSVDEIQAEAAPALGGIEPGFVRLGCLSCSLSEAGEKCPADYHLCTAMELHTGGYQVARVMGYSNWDTHVWTHGAFAKEQASGGGALAAELAFTAVKEGTQKLGLGLCCNDLR